MAQPLLYKEFDLKNFFQGDPMAFTSQLDLRGISWPMCLLQFKQNLLALGAGDKLEVLIQDPEVADYIILIVGRSADRLITRQKDGERLRLWIEKGENPDRGNNPPLALQSMGQRGDS
jgi:TusA-related sulfurtransferase